MKQKIVIVGGVAGGANVATRARRLSEEAEIVLFERGPYVSFANCGLPYYIGGEISDRNKLLVQTPKSLHDRFKLDVRINSEVQAIDRLKKQIVVKDLPSNKTYNESYDQLVLSTGAAPIRPPLPGIDRPGLFVLRDIPDMDHIISWMETHSVRNVAIVGGGYIGLEILEQLDHRKLDLTLIEALPQVMAPLDLEMAEIVQQTISSHNIKLILNDPVQSFQPVQAEEQALASVVVTKNGLRIPADMIIFSVGVKPETRLAKEAGLELGKLGGLVVDKYLRTSDPYIWAIGDCIEVTNIITGDKSLIPLAGPANRQGRIVADNILGKPVEYQGTLGTAVLRVFDLTVACTGANEKLLKQQNLPYEKVYLHPGSHAGYYPGSEPIALKVLFSSSDGKILGAQAIGKDGVEKRIDVIATAIMAGMTVDNLTELELCYSPPYGSAKDPVNLAGMVAQNVQNKLVDLAHWHDLTTASEMCFILDLRDDKERDRGYIPGSFHIPLNQLRDRLTELPKDKEIIAYCQSGQRSYIACRILKQNGFNCKNLSGAYKTWSFTK